jgi:hypothetical protein
MKKILSILLAVVLILGGGGYLLATAANASVPGDTLYTVDLLAEEVQRAVTTDDLALAELEQDILEERVAEIDEIVELGVDEYVVDDAVKQLERQRERTQERVLTLTSDTNKYDEAKKAEVTSRFEKVVQEQVQKMEEVQNKYMTAGEDAKKGIENAKKGMEESVETLTTLGIDLQEDGNGQGNMEQGEGSGDGIKDREANSDEETGNSNAPQTGR